MALGVGEERDKFQGGCGRPSRAQGGICGSGSHSSFFAQVQKSSPFWRQVRMTLASTE